MDQHIQKLTGANMDIDLATPGDQIAWQQEPCPWNAAEGTDQHHCAVKNVSICEYFRGVEYLDTLLCCYPRAGKTITAEFMRQYAHTWRFFERLVNDFDDDAWLHTGRKAMVPARLAFHIIKAVKYYIEDTSMISFASGKSFEINGETAQEGELPSRQDIAGCIREFKEKTNRWLSQTDLHAKNEPFPWAGETREGVALFLLSHTLTHIGELSTLLNESRQGDVEDHYVKAL